MSTQTTYLQTCSMKLDEVTKVSQMIKFHVEFSTIGITVNSDRETYSLSQARQIPEGNVLVTLMIPREGVYMPAFYREFSKALNQESTVVIQGERER